MTRPTSAARDAAFAFLIVGGEGYDSARGVVRLVARLSCEWFESVSESTSKSVDTSDIESSMATKET